MIGMVDDEPQVFNFVSSVEGPLRWAEFFTLGMRHMPATVHAVWLPALRLTSHTTLHAAQHWLLHLLPAYVVDSVARAFGKRTGYSKRLPSILYFACFLLNKD